jgi:hypothetical protein
VILKKTTTTIGRTKIGRTWTRISAKTKVLMNCHSPWHRPARGRCEPKRSGGDPGTCGPATPLNSAGQVAGENLSHSMRCFTSFSMTSYVTFVDALQDSEITQAAISQSGSGFPTGLFLVIVAIMV